VKVGGTEESTSGSSTSIGEARGADPTAGGPGARERAHAAREFGRLLRRAFEVVRQYKPTHVMARDARSRALGAALALVKAHGELELDLTAMALQHQGVAIEEAKRRTDSIALPLFREGVRRLTLTPEVTLDELEPFFDGWLGAWLYPNSADGVATRLWEHQPRGLRAVIIDTFEFSGAESDEPQGQGAAGVSVREQVDAIIGAIAAESLAGAADSRSTAVLSVSAEDVALLRSGALGDITRDQLASHDVAASTLAGLDDGERQALADELGQARAQAPARFVTALVNAALLGRDEERSRAVTVFADFARAMISQGQCELPFALYREQVGALPRDTSLPQMRVGLLGRLRDALLSPPVLDPLVAALDDPEVAASALAALKRTGKACVPGLRERLPKLTTTDGKQRLLKLLHGLDPGLAASLSQGTALDAGALTEALRVCERLPEAERLPLLQRGLNSADLSVRRLALQKVTPRLAALLPAHVLNNRLGDADADVRAAALALVVAIESPAALPAVIASLRRPIELHERLRLYQALATIGGAAAVQALATELSSRTDTEARVAAAAALGALKDPRGLEVVAQVAARLLTPPRLRAACRAALGVRE
jgi:hypothetical protein